MNQPPAQSFEVTSIKPVRRRLKSVGGLFLIVSLLGLATLRGKLPPPQPVVFETARYQLHAVLSELKSELIARHIVSKAAHRLPAREPPAEAKAAPGGAAGPLREVRRPCGRGPSPLGPPSPAS